MVIRRVERKTSAAMPRRWVGQFYTSQNAASFRCTEVRLIEIAGIDLKRDILDRMEFKPILNGTPRLMDERLFLPSRWV